SKSMTMMRDTRPVAMPMLARGCCLDHSATCAPLADADLKPFVPDIGTFSPSASGKMAHPSEPYLTALSAKMQLIVSSSTEPGGLHCIRYRVQCSCHRDRS